MQSLSFSSKISYRSPLFYQTVTIRTIFRSNNTNETRSYPTSGTASSLRFQLRSVCNHDTTIRDRYFNEGQDVFVRQYLGPQKWATGQILRRSGPLSYDVQVGDQVYSSHAFKLLQNRTGHQGSIWQSARAATGLSSTSESLRKLSHTPTWSANSNSEVNLRRHVAESTSTIYVRCGKSADRHASTVVTAPLHRHARR